MYLRPQEAFSALMEEYVNGLPDRIMELKLGIAGLMLNVNNDPQAGSLGLGGCQLGVSQNNEKNSGLSWMKRKEHRKAS